MHVTTSLSQSVRTVVCAISLVLLLPVFAVFAPAGSAAEAARTAVRGWSASALTVAPATEVRFAVRVTTGGRARARQVRVQTRISPKAAWSKPAWRRTTSRGRITLLWEAPNRETTRFVRVQVRKGPGQRAAVTRARRIDVRPLDSTPEPTPEPPPAPTPVPPPAPTPVPGADFAVEVVRLTNEARSQSRTCGDVAYPAVPPVAAQTQLAAAAQGHAEDMAQQNYFAHDSLDGRTPGQRITASGYAWRTFGENIAAGYPTPRAVVDGWLASPGHCRNLMGAGFTELGVGYATSTTSLYRTYWVQNFGAPR